MRLRLLLLTGLLAFLTSQCFAFSLEEVEADVLQDYPSVTHASPSTVQNAIAKSTPLVLDVREAGEFAVSHILGAARVSPDIRKSKFLELYGKHVKGRRVIFYCSVGVRSSELASLVRSELLKRRARDVQNLSGGIFRWHNEKKQLKNQRGRTDLVHPYNRRWGTLVGRSDKLRYKPGN